ncbi:UNVERIFIED_CONTAM: protein NLP2 [Sesamum radiatum]|uniref:Protein NLP2 n=1 Tax=Sesamum radiatum TaxID=300843 RepID=A0AAW2S2Z0_SESRA
MDSQQKGKETAVSFSNRMEEPEREFKLTTQWDNSGSDLHNVPAVLEHDELQRDSGPQRSGEGGGSFSLTIGHLPLGTQTSSERRRTKTEKSISLQVLRQYFAGSLKEAARSIGVCPTTLKRICRQHGITRWPSRKIKKVGHSLRKLQLVIDSVHGSDGSIQLSSFYNNFPELVPPNVPGSSHFSTSTMSHNLQKQSSNPVNVSSLGDALSAEQNRGLLKRTRSEAKLHEKGQEEAKPLIRSYSHKIFSDHTAIAAPAVPNDINQAHHVGTFRVKAVFGEEKIRFSLQPHWGYEDLKQEVLRRINIDNGGSINLKYLDDDAEWVLLTCDADLEECIDLHRSSQSRTIKLSVNQACRPSIRSSFRSDGPS